MRLAKASLPQPVAGHFCDPITRPDSDRKCQVPCPDKCVVGAWSSWSSCNLVFLSQSPQTYCFFPCCPSMGSKINIIFPFLAVRQIAIKKKIEAGVARSRRLVLHESFVSGTEPVRAMCSGAQLLHLRLEHYLVEFLHTSRRSRLRSGTTSPRTRLSTQRWKGSQRLLLSAGMHIDFNMHERRDTCCVL